MPDTINLFRAELPGESPVIVGQNPRAASSIGQTQHSQMCSGDARWWPCLLLRPPNYDRAAKPLELKLGPDAFVELVQVGDLPDSVRQLRQHFGPFLARFSATCYPTRAA